MGRSSTYEEEIANEVCDRLTEGESLMSICEDDTMPHASTVFRWLDTNAEFRDKYARAREVQGHLAADRAVDAAVNATDAGLGRLAYDARKWQASKLAPKVYGDKTEVAVTGPNGGPMRSETRLSLDPMEASRAYQRFISEDK
jgi:hypothetical protein